MTRIPRLHLDQLRTRPESRAKKHAAADVSERRNHVRDALVLLLLCAVCATAYVWRLRYYSDDFLFLVPLGSSATQTWSGLFHALSAMPYAAVRPGQILWYIALHKWAHDDPLVAHVANQVAFAASVLVLHAFLRVMPSTRPAAYYVAVLYACLPTFSVAKMWYANYQSALSLLMFAVTSLMVASIATGSARRRWALLPAVTLTAAISNMFYELFSVIELGVPLFVWWALGLRPRQWMRERWLIGTTIALACGFAVSTAYKLPYHYGFDVPTTAAALPSFVHRAGSLYFGAAKLTFWTLGAYSPAVAAGFLSSEYLQPGSLIAPAAVLLILAAREYGARRTAGERTSQAEAGAAGLGLVGVTVFVLGYVPYLSNFLYSPKPWGEGNRGNVAAALGAALLFYVALRWLRLRTPLLASALVVGFCAIGAFLQVAVGAMWDRSADIQDQVLARFAELTRDSVPDGATVLVYGTCPYYGAGPVFPYGWDLAGRLRLETGRALTAVIVVPKMQILDQGVATPAGRWSETFPYWQLWILDFPAGSFTALRNRQDALAYFAAHPLARSTTCRFDYGAGNPLY